jgi:hypothetical protein
MVSFWLDLRSLLRVAELRRHDVADERRPT